MKTYYFEDLPEEFQHDVVEQLNVEIDKARPNEDDVMEEVYDFINRNNRPKPINEWQNLTINS